jgi:hypothetical protein
LLKKTSGNFLYAATVAAMYLQFVITQQNALESFLASNLLNIVTTCPLPLKSISLYIHIFSGVQNLKKVLEIVVLILDPITEMTPEAAVGFLGLKPGKVEMLLGDLSSIISVTSCQPMYTLPGSLGDFLLDPLRSRTFYLDIPLMNSRLFFEHIKTSE